MPFILTMFLMSFLAFAQNNPINLKKVKIVNFNIDYEFPLGTGTLEKLSVGAGSKSLLNVFPFRLELNEESKSFFFYSDLIDFTWENPPVLLSDVNKIQTKNLNASSESRLHSLDLEKLVYGPNKKDNYEFEKISFKCEGANDYSQLKVRVFENCRESLSGVVVKMDDFFLRYILSILEKLPLPPGSASEKMVNDLEISIINGRLKLDYAVRYVISTALHVIGTVQYENDYKTIAVKIDSIKYGFLPVTGLVMNQLRTRIKHPRVKVSPPYIRVEIN